jgi:hypothetical protein
MFGERLEKFLGSGYAHLIIVSAASSSWNALQAHLKKCEMFFPGYERARAGIRYR